MPAAPDGPSERAFLFMPAALQPSDPSPSDGPHVVLREDGIENNAGKVFAWNTTGSGKTLTSFKASTLRGFEADYSSGHVNLLLRNSTRHQRSDHAISSCKTYG